ncbi:diguanylate cyclase [Vibrio hepatarius]|uniref:sensor domain-containing diguanylate cyclase n=1 Tax=Vibrio hepatarius TaxID=171383 RepID=UPI003735D461
MVATPISKILYLPIIALALSFIAGAYLFQKTLENWTTEIVSDHMLGLLNDVQHEIVEKQLHIYDFSSDEIDDFLDNLSQSTSDQRFTIIHSSGKLLGDSHLKKHEVNSAENFSQRPEVQAALADGIGVAKRFNTTSNQDFLHVAARVEIIDPHHFQEHNEEDTDVEHDHHDEHESEHEVHDSIYVIRLAVPMASVYRMAKDLELINYLIMAFSMIVLLSTSWYAYRSVAAVVGRDKREQQLRIDRSTLEIDLLRQLATTLAACKSMEEATFVVKDVVPRILGDINGCISIMRESQNLLEVVIDWGGKWPGAVTFAPDDCWAMRKGKYHLSKEKNQHLDCGHMSGMDTSDTTICIPLIAHGNTMGLFHLYFSSEDKPIDEETKQLAFTLAEHLGLALANLRLQETLRSQAMRDPLTGLYNRRLFEDMLEKEYSTSYQTKAPLSVQILDIDHFKQFNDNFGHDAGDFVLKEIANLMTFITEGQGVVCRIGGEEFAVVCPNLSSEQAVTLAETIVESVKKLHLDMKGLSLGQLGISAGIATFPDADVSYQGLVKLADNALYEAKNRGRSQAVHSSDMQ